MRSFKTEAIIIKRRNIGEADRLITIFTKEQGKMTVKASGIRRISSRRSAHVELLNYSQLALHKTQNTAVLTEALIIDNFAEIKEDLAKVGLAYHLCELVDGLCPDQQENRGVFSLLLQTLHQLSGTTDCLPIVHEFEIELLKLLGFWHLSQQESLTLDTHHFIESILERKLKSHKIFSKL